MERKWVIILGKDPLNHIKKVRCNIGLSGALGRNRTFNLDIKSVLLCQLSYECN